MPPLLACVTLVEKVPDWEWVPSDRRAENPGIREQEDDLRLNFWIKKGQPDETK